MMRLFSQTPDGGVYYEEAITHDGGICDRAVHRGGGSGPEYERRNALARESLPRQTEGEIGHAPYVAATASSVANGCVDKRPVS